MSEEEKLVEIRFTVYLSDRKAFLKRLDELKLKRSEVITEFMSEFIEQTQPFVDGNKQQIATRQKAREVWRAERRKEYRKQRDRKKKKEMKK